MQILVAITHHGFGHAARQMEIARRMHELDGSTRVTFWTGVPELVFSGYLGEGDWWRVEDVRMDVGLVQPDSLGHDLDATHEALEDLWSGDGPVPALAERMRHGAFDHGIMDVPPAGMLAAARVGLDFTVTASFDWAFIYGHYAEHDARFERWRDVSLEAHAASSDVLWMQPGPDPVGFERARSIGLVARQATAAGASWRASVAGEGERLVLLSFGGLGLDRIEERIPRLDGIRWITAPPTPRLEGRTDVTEVMGISYPDLVHGVDVVLSKPGYGIITECAANRTRFVYARREGFPEIPHLERWLEGSMSSVALERFDEQGVEEAIEAVLAERQCFPSDTNGATRIAEHVLGQVEGKA